MVQEGSGRLDLMLHPSTRCSRNRILVREGIRIRVSRVSVDPACRVLRLFLPLPCLHYVHDRLVFRTPLPLQSPFYLLLESSVMSTSLPLPYFFVPICRCDFLHPYLRLLTHPCLPSYLCQLVLYLDRCPLWKALPRPSPVFNYS